ncbi:MAG: hypothetical protein WB443_12940 [Nitrososphaeraceae archaeon]
MFVRDDNSCKLYDFKLNQSRTGVILNGTLSNKVANTPQDAQSVLFASESDGFTSWTWYGYLYVLTLAGSTYKNNSCSSFFSILILITM